MNCPGCGVPDDQGCFETCPEVSKPAFKWTTDDEVAFINHLYEEGKRTGNWKAVEHYPSSVYRRRWDSEVDVDEVYLTAQRAANRAKFYREAHQ